MLAYCGILCDGCPIHLATLEQDLSRQIVMRESIAEQCNKHYGMNLRPVDVNDCDGCRAGTGRIFSGCLNCGIKKCAVQKNIENCAFCDDYACDKLNDFFRHDPDAKSRLDEIRKTNKIL